MEDGNGAGLVTSPRPGWPAPQSTNEWYSTRWADIPCLWLSAATATSSPWLPRIVLFSGFTLTPSCSNFAELHRTTSGFFCPISFVFVRGRATSCFHFNDRPVLGIDHKLKGSIRDRKDILVYIKCQKIDYTDKGRGQSSPCSSRHRRCFLRSFRRPSSPSRPKSHERHLHHRCYRTEQYKQPIT